MKHKRTLAEPAEFAMRAAALLRGGVLTARVIDTIAHEHDSARSGTLQSTAMRLSEAIDRGATIPEALAREAHPGWRVLAAAWRTAEQTGAPFASALERAATALHSLQELEQRRSVLLQGPRSTIVIVCALPFIAFLMGELIGFHPTQQFTEPIGLLMLVVGGILLVAGIAWSTWMVHSVATEDRVDGLELDLLWIALGSGHSPETGLRLIADSVDASRAEWIPFRSLMNDGAARHIIRLAEESGSPIRALLLAEADGTRSQTRAELERSAERLAVRVLIPLGVCILPSFIVLGVLPVIVSMISTP